MEKKPRSNPKVDPYFIDGCGRCSLWKTPECKVKTWQPELNSLRKILLESELSEDLKWSIPCYTLQNNNVVLISAFKGYCAVTFFKGALLKDKENILVQQTENTQAARQIRFTSTKEIKALAPVLTAYINEAIAIEKSGQKVNFKPTSEFHIAEEFQQKLKQEPALKKAFDALTPGRQRGYLLHFSAARQSSTRQSRVEKCMPKILAGKGLQD